MRWAIFRIAAAVIAFSGVVAGFIVNVDRAIRTGQDLGAVLANYFSLFTIISTLLATVVLVVAAVWAIRHPRAESEPLGLAVALGAVTAPVLLLGLVYNALLRGPSSFADPAGIAVLDTWAVESLHVVLPLYFLVDLVFGPRRQSLPWWSLAVLVSYPLAWTGYTMVRGELVANPDGSAPWWYPYPFLDPHGSGGWTSALLYIGAILVAFLLIDTMIILINHHRVARRSRRGSAPAAGALPA